MVQGRIMESWPIDVYIRGFSGMSLTESLFMVYHNMKYLNFMREEDILLPWQHTSYIITPSPQS